MSYEFGRETARLESKIVKEYPEKLDVFAGEMVFIGGRVLALTLRSEVLEEQHVRARLMMAQIGVKGAMKEPPVIHATVAESNRPLKLAVREEIAGVMTELLPDVLPAVPGTGDVEAGLPPDLLVHLTQTQFYTDKDR